MSTLKPYPAYKPAAVPWLEQVPEHWEEMKVKYIFRERIEKGYPSEPLLAATQSMGVVTKETYGERTVTAQKDLHLLKLVEKEDFVISLRSFQGGIEVSHARGIISPAYTILRINRPCAPGYLAFLLKSAPFIDGLKLFITGIREGQNIDYVRLSRTLLPWPSLDEQHLIVRYLHALDAKVKRYIRTKRKLIAALQEQKQAIIQQAVTRGLNPNVKLKPSGVEWLGEVPEHWEVVRSNRLFRHRKERARDGDRQLTASQKYGVIPQDKFMELEGRRVMQVFLDADILKHVEAGDFVISMRSFQGGLEYSEHSGCISSAYIPIVSQGAVHTGFFKYLFKCDSYIKALASTSDLVRDGQAMRFDNFRAVDLVLIPLDEQRRISEYLTTKLKEETLTIERIEREIVLMKEYHTRLIADVVTGAVDVRAAAKAMAVEVPEGTEEEPVSIAAEGEAEYGNSEE